MIRSTGIAPCGLAIGVLTILLATASCGEPMAEPIVRAPVNTWVRLPDAATPGYDWSQPVYVPSRGQVLQWGGIPQRYRVTIEPRNDVLAFDASAGHWGSDYPSTKGMSGLLLHSRAGRGVGYAGTGAIGEDGIPVPSVVANGVCWDSKRMRLVYTMAGLMAAYDPATKTWSEIESRTEFQGNTHDGPPMVYGPATGYDPVNDEIVLFPHWQGRNDASRFVWLDKSRVDVDGRISGHLGTFVFSFKDHTWRHVTGKLGSADIEHQRQSILDVLKQLTAAFDEARKCVRGKGDASGIAGSLAAVAKATEQAGVAGNARRHLQDAAQQLYNAADAAKQEQWQAVMDSCRAPYWALDGILENDLRVEPPPRTATPLVYDPANQVLVLFGGHGGLVRVDLHGPGGYAGALSDTWIYDCRARCWRELNCRTGPPIEDRWDRQPKIVYDPKSGKIILVTFRCGLREGPYKCAIYSLDVAKESWTCHGDLAFPDRLFYGAAATAWFEMALDEKHGLLLVAQNVVRPDRTLAQQTFAMKLDLSNLPAEPCPAYAPPTPVKPAAIPPDDPEWVARLKSLPANTWTPAEPQGNGGRRDWGGIECDPLRAVVAYSGGGHSTYQIRDVAVYAVGANVWINQAGEHNDYLPPVGWGGAGISYLGATNACHNCNYHVMLDGRRWWNPGVTHYLGKYPEYEGDGPRLAVFYDVDLGGVWRAYRTESVRFENGAEDTMGSAHVVDPAGRIMGFGGALRPAPPREPGHFSIYDIDAKTLTVRKVDDPMPDPVGEGRPFCYLPDRDQVFYLEEARHKDPSKAMMRTWVYDVKINKFEQLAPKRSPVQGEVTVAEYLQDEKAVYAVIRASSNREHEEWLYSFDRNDWARLPTTGTKSHFTQPYGQLAYVAKYGVLVSVRGTYVLRPDVDAAEWD